MRHSFLTFVPLLIASSLLAQHEEPAAKEPAAAKVDFEKQILPILEKNCVECHTTKPGPDGKVKKPKGGITFDTKDGLMAEKKKVKLLVPKKPDESAIYNAITLPADHDDRMPPAKKGAPLSKEQTDLIKQWIDEGADFGKWVGAKPDPKSKDAEKPKGAEKPKDAEKPKANG
jgi:uncharacterized membrane protein